MRTAGFTVIPPRPPCYHSPVEPTHQSPRKGLPFVSGVLAELALLVVAVFGAKMFHRPLRSNFWIDSWSLVVGIIAALPPWLVFYWTLKSENQAVAPHRHLLEQWVRPLFSRWSLLQLALISTPSLARTPWTSATSRCSSRSPDAVKRCNTSYLQEPFAWALVYSGPEGLAVVTNALIHAASARVREKAARSRWITAKAPQRRSEHERPRKLFSFFRPEIICQTRRNG